jgi:hypothetical protein
MKNIKKTYFKSMEVFQRLRLKTLEQEYDKLHLKPENNKILNDLHNNLLELLGENKNLLFDYADRLIAKYCTDTLWFYDSGFQDCQELNKLFKETIMGVKEIPYVLFLGCEIDCTKLRNRILTTNLCAINCENSSA